MAKKDLAGRSRHSARDGGNTTGDSRSLITLAGLPIALADEMKHFKFIGTTGTGKSTAINEILCAALDQGDRAVIADPDGGYLGRFYNEGRGDVILNPFHPDSLKWNILDEINTDYDVDQLARSLIPEGSGSDKTWAEYARTFFIAVVQQTLKAGVRDDAEIYHAVTKATLPELKLLLAGSIADPSWRTPTSACLGRSCHHEFRRARASVRRAAAGPTALRAKVDQPGRGAAQPRPGWRTLHPLQGG